MRHGRIQTELFQKNRGVVGEVFGPVSCYSCDNVHDYGIDIKGQTPLGKLINVGTIEITESDGSIQEIPSTVTVCENCLEDLLEAKRIQEE